MIGSEIAILMAAGLGSRLRPVTNNMPKPLVKINGKPMIETLIDGLILRGIQKFIVVTGYLSNKFEYLKKIYSNIEIVYNPDYISVNNISSIKTVTPILTNTNSDVFICEADLYIKDKNIFDCDLDSSCYFGKMVRGYSGDWVFELNSEGKITRVGKSGRDVFNMVGISYFKNEDAKKLAMMIDKSYGIEGYENLFWDEVVNQNLDKLALRVHEIFENQIFEIDTVEELSELDPSYNCYLANKNI